jgi:hypothetical protein
MKLANLILGTAVLGAAAMSPVVVQAADRDFCRAYTDNALRQAAEARQSRFCARQIDREPARWSQDPRGHFDWCRRTDRRAVEAEQFYRSGFLRDCRRRG